MKQLTLSVVMCLTVCFITGCWPSKMWYAIAIQNESAQDLSDVALKFDNNTFQFDFGILVDGGLKGYQNVDVPLADTATLTWKDASGDKHSETVHFEKIHNDINYYSQSDSVIIRIAKDGSVDAQLE